MSTPWEIYNRGLEVMRRQPPFPKEQPALEELVVPDDAQLSDHRPRLIKTQKPYLLPRPNKFYDSLRTQDGWENCADAWAHGSITTIPGSTVTQTVSFVSSTRLRTSEWPGGTNFFLCVRSFGIAPTTAPATVGAIECTFQDNSSVAVLGDFVSNSGGNNGLNVLMLTPITDPNPQTIGQLAVFLNGGATAATYLWSIGFSVVYLLPETANELRAEEKEVHHEHNVHTEANM